MARISDRARFCHNCGTAIVPQGQAGEPSEVPCPCCGDSKKLNSRSLGDKAASVLECPQCAGLWIGREVFRIVAEKARSSAASADAFTGASGTPPWKNAPAPQKGPMYRKCPECGGMMHRRNFGKRSGVIIDQCKDHGMWFDAQELERILAWIREGGEARSRRRDQREQQERNTRVQRFTTERIERMGGQHTSGGGLFDERSSTGGLLGGVLGALFDL
jgi:Zn-finger nucleic acid-binding protein